MRRWARTTQSRSISTQTARSHRYCLIEDVTAPFPPSPCPLRALKILPRGSQASPCTTPRTSSSGHKPWRGSTLWVRGSPCSGSRFRDCEWVRTFLRAPHVVDRILSARACSRAASTTCRLRTSSRRSTSRWRSCGKRMPWCVFAFRSSTRMAWALMTAGSTGLRHRPEREADDCEWYHDGGPGEYQVARVGPLIAGCRCWTKRRKTAW